MTRPTSDVARVLALARENLTALEIARATTIPRSTVRDWLRRALPTTTHRARCWRCDPTLVCPERPYVHLLGAYLGDGHLAQFARGVYRLTLSQDARYGPPHRRVGAPPDSGAGQWATPQRRGGCVAINSYSKHWPCVFPQHGPGAKHLRAIELEPWQAALVEKHPRELVRGLIESDGCRHLNSVVTRGKRYEYTRYAFTNASEDILGIFTRACDLLGTNWTRMNHKTIAVSRREDVAYLDTFIGPKS